KIVRVALGRGLAAALSSGGAVEASAWAADDAVEEEFETAADRLTLLSVGSEAGRAAISVFTAPDGDAAARSIATPLERQAVRRETLIRAVRASGSGETLRVRGLGAEAAYFASSGKIVRGTDIPLEAGGGTLEIAHAPGPLLCWIDGADGKSGAWGAE